VLKHSRRRFSFLPDRRGSSLIVALIFSLVLAVIMAASLSRSIYSWLNVQRSYRFNQALQVAESGIEQTLLEMNHNLDVNYDNTQLSGTIVDGWGTHLGEYEVTVVPNPDHSSIKIITSHAAVPLLSSSRRIMVDRTVRVSVRRTEFAPDLFNYAIYTPRFIDTNGITEIHGNTKSGEMIETSGGDDPHDRVEQYTYDWYDEENGVWVTDQAQVVEGLNLDADPTNDVVLPFDEFTLEQLKEISIAQGYYFEYEPDEDELPASYWWDEAAQIPNVVYITSDIHITGNYNFGGLIIIVGDLISEDTDIAFGGSHEIDGIIYTTGGFRTHGGGNVEINIDGAVFCGSATMQGHARIDYNWTYVNALKNLTAASQKFRLATWREVLPGEEEGSDV